LRAKRQAVNYAEKDLKTKNPFIPVEQMDFYLQCGKF